MTENANGAAELTVDGTTLELPRHKASIGMDGFRVDKMLASTGTVTLVPGFTNTASGESEITYNDGDVGILRSRRGGLDRGHRARQSCTVRTRSVSTSGSVSMGTP